MISTAHYPTDTAILSEVIAPDRPSLSLEHAQWLLTLKFSDQQQLRMQELAEKGNRGELSTNEIEELERFQRIGMMLNLLQAKAQLSLHHSSLGR